MDVIQDEQVNLNPIVARCDRNHHFSICSGSLDALSVHPTSIGCLPVAPQAFPFEQVQMKQPASWSNTMGRSGNNNAPAFASVSASSRFGLTPSSGLTNEAASMVDRGLDVKGEGSYLVAPPTLHKSGARYQWIKLVPIAEAPKWLLDALDTSLKSRQLSKPNGEDKSNDSVPTGTLGERPSHIPKRMDPKAFADARIKTLAPDFPPWSAVTEADLDNLLEHIDGATRDYWRDVGVVFAHWIIVKHDLEPMLRKKFDDWSLRWPDRFNATDQENQWRDWVQRADSRKKNGGH